MPANDLVWDAMHGLIYLSVPSAAGPDGNVIMAIDPSTGATVATQFAGSEPDTLSISDDDQFLYAGIDGAASVQRFILPDLTPDISYSLGADSFYGPYFALDLQVAPGAPQTTAVSTANAGFSPEQGSIIIFDDATARSTIASSEGYDSLQWGGVDTALYAANNMVSSFDFYILAVNASGVQQTADYGNVFSEFGVRIHYDSGTGLVYADDGHVLTPETGQPVGTFAAEGPMAPDSSTNTAYFAVNSAGSYAIETFDQSQFTTIVTTPLNNVINAPMRLIRWGATGLAFNTSGGPVYLTGSTGSTTGTSFGLVPLGQAAVSFVSLPATDIVWDQAHALIYASVPSTASSNGNSIAAVNPVNGMVGTVQFAGSDPDVLAISDDEQFLYAGIDGSGLVQRFDLPTLTPDLSFALGSGSFGDYYALDLQAAPGAPDTVAVSLGSSNVEPAAVGGVQIYDDGVARPMQAGGYTSAGGGLYDTLQWGADATAIYAADYEDTAFSFYSFAVNSSGVQLSNQYGNDFPGYNFNNRIHFDQTTGIVYGDDGYTAIPATGLPAGFFDASGVMVPDGSIKTAFFLGQSEAQAGSSSYEIVSYDMTRYTPVAGIVINGVSGTPERLIRWGSNGLAFCTSSGIYLISGSFVAAQAAPASGPRSLDARVRRTWPGPRQPNLVNKRDPGTAHRIESPANGSCQSGSSSVPLGAPLLPDYLRSVLCASTRAGRQRQE